MVVERGRKKGKAPEITDVKSSIVEVSTQKTVKTCLDPFDLRSPVCKIQTLIEESSENH